eukprot:12126234-Alexandrium_andersonii.AAC.1
MASAPPATPTANWRGRKACPVAFLSASTRRPVASLRIESLPGFERPGLRTGAGAPFLGQGSDSAPGHHL